MSVPRFTAAAIASSSDGVALAHPGACLAQLGERERERVQRTDLVVAVGADQEQMAGPGLCQHQVQESKRRRVGPLQVVEKEDPRVIG
jgi:hypothetical protein